MSSLFRVILAAFCLVPAAYGDETLVQRKLRQLIDEERIILNGSRRADGTYDEEILERRFQGLVHKYDVLIQENPRTAAALVAYSRVLEKVGQEETAYALYLRANKLDPNIPLVKNQLGNFLAEQGQYAQALPYYLAAIELAPDEPLYHYQLGSLLHHFRDEFIKSTMFTRVVLDEKMIEAFGKAARLGPDQIPFAYRYAEAFYDLEQPRWEEALDEWRNLEEKVKPGIERQAIWLHQAHVLLRQGKRQEAQTLIDRVEEPVLAQNKKVLVEQLAARKE